MSSVASLSPLFLIRISLSSMRQAMFSTAEPRAKMFDGLSAESPYAAFFCSSRSRTELVTSMILSDVGFILNCFTAKLIFCGVKCIPTFRDTQVAKEIISTRLCYPKQTKIEWTVGLVKAHCNDGERTNAVVLGVVHTILLPSLHCSLMNTPSTVLPLRSLISLYAECRQSCALNPD